MTFTRRDFIRATAALTLAAPLSGMARAATSAREVDVIVIGAGAAGIAAGRRIAAAGKSVLVLEASERLGGRCHTDKSGFAVPFDRGARWLYAPDGNPVVRHAREAGIALMPAAQGQKIRIGRRNARAGEAETFLATLARANRAIETATRRRGDKGEKADFAAASALPGDLGDWEEATHFVLGVWRTGKDLRDLSAQDHARMPQRLGSLASNEGLGSVMTTLGGSVPVALSTPATQIRWGGRSVSVETREGRISARAVIVTVSTHVLAAGNLTFTPDLPKRQVDAIAGLGLGSYDRIALELPGNPLGLAQNDTVIERSATPETGLLLANIGGSSLCTVDVGGAFGRELSAQGEAAMVAFATDWLSRLFGGEIADKVTRSAATRWNHVPGIGGAMSAAAPGGHAGRAVLMEPLQNLYFAGEACHETQWGTVGGAWESGERAADAALKAVAASVPPVAAKRRRTKQRRAPAKR